MVRTLDRTAGHPAGKNNIAPEGIEKFEFPEDWRQVSSWMYGSPLDAAAAFPVTEKVPGADGFELVPPARPAYRVFLWDA